LVLPPLHGARGYRGEYRPSPRLYRSLGETSRGLECHQYLDGEAGHPFCALDTFYDMATEQINAVLWAALAGWTVLHVTQRELDDLSGVAMAQEALEHGKGCGAG